MAGYQTTTGRHEQDDHGRRPRTNAAFKAARPLRTNPILTTGQPSAAHKPHDEHGQSEVTPPTKIPPRMASRRLDPPPPATPALHAQSVPSGRERPRHPAGSYVEPHDRPGGPIAHKNP
jgi:hypothetical protein